MEETKIFKILRFAAEREFFTVKEICDGTGLPWDEVRNYASILWPGGVTREGIFEKSGGSYVLGSFEAGEQEYKYQITHAAMMRLCEWQLAKEDLRPLP
jgi:hypothetical protein